MTKLALVALLVGATTLVACGGDDDVNLVDSGPLVDAAQRCDPVQQTGCAEGEKCARLVISAPDPFLARTDCVPDGDVAIGEACENGEPGETTGFDDCAAGGQCFNGLCLQICTGSPETCSEGFGCGFPVNFFDDIDSARVGVCFETCSPVAQDCVTEGEGCYLNIGAENGEGTCVAVPDDAADLTQESACLLNGDVCFLNGCDIGFAPYPPFSRLPEEISAECTAYCQPVDTYLNDPDGDGEANGDGTPENPDVFGNAVGEPDDGNPDTPLVDCSSARLGDAFTSYQCRFFQSIGDGQGGVLDQIPATYGFCVDPLDPDAGNFWGDCSKTSFERQFKAFDEGYPDEMKTGSAAVTAFCTDFPEQCGVTCTSNDKFDEIATAYCDANTGSPICAPARSTSKAMWDIYYGRYRSDSTPLVR
jgi:hypothetical protein